MTQFEDGGPSIEDLRFLYNFDYYLNGERIYDSKEASFPSALFQQNPAFSVVLSVESWFELDLILFSNTERQCKSSINFYIPLYRFNVKGAFECRIRFPFFVEERKTYQPAYTSYLYFSEITVATYPTQEEMQILKLKVDGLNIKVKMAFNLEVVDCSEENLFQIEYLPYDYLKVEPIGETNEVDFLGSSIDRTFSRWIYSRESFKLGWFHKRSYFKRNINKQELELMFTNYEEILIGNPIVEVVPLLTIKRNELMKQNGIQDRLEMLMA